MPPRSCGISVDGRSTVMSDLLPCPFCGDTAPELYRDDSRHRVQCGSCGGQSNGFDLAKKAADAWNRRLFPPKCLAKGPSPGEPPECNWPDCGCDSHAMRVIEALLEQGWAAPRIVGETAAAQGFSAKYTPEIAVSESLGRSWKGRAGRCNFFDIGLTLHHDDVAGFHHVADGESVPCALSPAERNDGR